MKVLTSYHRAVAFLESLPALEPGRPPGRGVGSGHDRRGAAMMAALGRPELGPRFIHVGGTSGKGSTVSLLHRAYHGVGMPVFSFTSPHLTTTLERFAFRGGLCPLPVFLEAAEEVKRACLDLHTQGGVGAPGYFDALFALALVAARILKADPVILEVGLGGRLDGTNLIPPPVVAVVTEVGLDHVRILGDTIPEIALDKAGIFKSGSRALSGSQRPEAQGVLEAEAKGTAGSLVQVGRDCEIVTEGDLHRFQYGSLSFDLPHSLTAVPYGRQNLGTALGALAIAGEGGLPFDGPSMAQAMAQGSSPGRFEVMEPSQGSGAPIVLDVAHNPDKLSAFAKLFSSRYGREGTVIFGLSRDKNLRGSIRAIAPYFKTLIPTRTLLTHRPLWRPREIAEAGEGSFDTIKMTIDPWTALELGRGQGEPMAITGSTYLVGDLRREWESEADILRRGVASRGR